MVVNAIPVQHKPTPALAFKWDGTRVPIITLQEMGASVTEASFRYTSDGGVMVRTLQGWVRGEPGDWLIISGRGEVYPIKEDVFREDYEA